MAGSAAVDKTGGQGQKKTRGFPRVIHAGHGIKLGAVVSTFPLLPARFTHQAKFLLPLMYIETVEPCYTSTDRAGESVCVGGS